MRILFISAYEAESHRIWREGVIAAFPEHEWTSIVLPPRYFSWRIRANAYSIAFSPDTSQTLARPYDLMIATSMTDVASLRGFVPHLANVPCLLYVHENQFLYPESGREHPSADAQVTPLFAALAADRILFNSDFNRRTFFAGARAFLKKMPDLAPLAPIDLLEERASVLPVPVSEKWIDQGEKAERFTIVWNHRWEFDKAPERLEKPLRMLMESGADFRVHLLGQRFRQKPAVLARLEAMLGDRLGTSGHIADSETYRALVRESHVVISTALHDFQGLAVIEAVLAECVPVLPDRLAYQELFPQKFRYASHPQEEDEARAMGEMLIQRAREWQSGTLPASPDMTGLTWPSLRARYAEAITQTASQGRRPIGAPLP